MKRLWLVMALGFPVAAVRGDDLDWRPAGPLPPPVSVAPGAPLAPATPPASVPAPVPTTPPAIGVMPIPGGDAPAFQPSPSQPVSIPLPGSTRPNPAPASLPPIQNLTPADKMVSSEPQNPQLSPRFPLVTVPDLQNSTGDDKPDTVKPKQESKSEPLPPPRPVSPDPAKTPTDPAPKTTPPANTPPSLNLAAAAPATDNRPVLEPLPNSPGTLNGIPVRGRTFGTPPLQLSRDFALRDLFGLDMQNPKSGPDVSGAGQVPGGPTDRYFLEAEYLLWWVNPQQIPVLATTTNGTGQGFLGQPGTIPLLGPGSFGNSLRSGFRIRGGGWLDECTGCGFDASFFFLGPDSTNRNFSGYPTLVRPFFAPNFNAEFGEVIAQPNLSTGSFSVQANSFLWGFDANYKQVICRSCEGTTAWFAGYRNVNLAESLTMTESITASGPLAPDPVGTRVLVQDQFKTYNNFQGGQIGWLTNRRYGQWEFDFRASVALGVNVETLDISGFQQRTRPGQATQFFNGGLLATGSNLGQFTSTRFGVIPEVTTSVGYAITDRLKLTVGYNLLYWNSVIRPGDQIDRIVDVTQVPNPPTGVAASGQNRPIPLFKQTDFWAQGITFGAQYRW